MILDALIITLLQDSKPVEKHEDALFNLSAPALSMWVGAHPYI